MEAELRNRPGRFPGPRPGTRIPLSAFRRTTRLNPVVVLGLLVVVVVVAVLQFVFLPGESVAGAPLAFVISLVIVVLAGRDDDGTAVVLAWALRLLVGAVVFRLMSGMAGGIPDWLSYDREGWYLAEAVRAGSGLPAFSLGGAADNVSTFVGYVYAVVGRSTLSVAVIETALGLAASWTYLKVCRMLVPRPRAIIRYGILFFPSFVFWTSFVGKDPFVNLGLALGVYGAVALCLGRGRTLGSIARMVASVVLCLLFRPHLVLILLPALMAGMSFSLLRGPAAASAAAPYRPTWGRRLAVVLTLVACIGLAPALARAGAGRRLWVEEGGIDAWVAKAGQIRELGSRGGGSSTGYVSYSSLPGYLRALPGSMATLFFRPFVWEVHNAVAAVAAVDTLLLTGVCLWLLVSVLTRRGWFWHQRSRPATAFLLVWAAAWALMFVNMTGNLGTMVRQRVQIVPVVLLLAALAVPEAGARAVAGNGRGGYSA